MANAISTYQVYLMKYTGTDSASKVVDIKDFPDLVSVPETIETTTLTDGARTYIPGIRNDEQKTFTANYLVSDFTTLQGYEGTESTWGVWFGADTTGQPDGHDGKFQAKGYLNVSVTGGGVNEAVGMTITLTLTEGFKYIGTT